jgi:hypothetical protein
MLEANAKTLQDAEQYKEALLVTLFGALPQTVGGAPPQLTDVIPPESNILGVGYGTKITAGATVDEIALRVYVRAKMPARDLPDAEKVPAVVNSLPTDVIPVGDINALHCGGSVGHVAISAGTLGCLVQRTGTGAPTQYILSNNHVLADLVTVAAGTVPPLGDPIVAPGPLDGGVDPADRVATLTDWEPISYTSTNYIDAAIAELKPGSPVTPDILKIGRVVNPPVPAKLYQSVRKHGRTTHHTVGVVVDVSATIKVRFGTRLSSFDRQLGIIGAGGAFSAGGDSGSLIVDAVTLQPVGLLFAGGGGQTFANPIDPVLAHFGVTIV